MEKSILSPKSDYIFKCIFGDYKNIDILGNFLQAVLDLPASEYSHLTIVDPHLLPDVECGKTGVLDVKVHTISGKIIEIEIQVLDVPQLRERITFYISKMITEQIGKGQDYDTIERVISIVITDYTLITENSDYHNQYRLRNKKNDSEFTDVLEVNTLELTKLPEQPEDTDLWRWMQFLKTDNKEVLTMLSTQNSHIEKAVGVLMNLSQDEQVRLREEAREKERRDNSSRMKGAMQEGILRGKLEGKLEEKSAIIERMHMQGISVDVISTIADFPLEKVNQIIKGLQ